MLVGGVCVSGRGLCYWEGSVLVGGVCVIGRGLCEWEDPV